MTFSSCTEPYWTGGVPPGTELYWADKLIGPGSKAILAELVTTLTESLDGPTDIFLHRQVVASVTRALAPSEGAPIRSVRAFALTIARNVALDWIRHQRVVPVDLVADMAALDVLDERAKVDEIVSAREELELLADVVQGLPKRCRQAFTLRRVYGLSQKEIAAQLGISENTVEQLLTRAVRRCAEALFERQERVEAPDSITAALRTSFGLRAEDDGRGMLVIRRDRDFERRLNPTAVIKK
jgi:RNA polymerase sigma factor (sigma-70 family)